MEDSGCSVCPGVTSEVGCSWDGNSSPRNFFKAGGPWHGLRGQLCIPGGCPPDSRRVLTESSQDWGSPLWTQRGSSLKGRGAADEHGSQCPLQKVRGAESTGSLFCWSPLVTSPLAQGIPLILFFWLRCRHVGS